MKTKTIIILLIIFLFGIVMKIEAGLNSNKDNNIVVNTNTVDLASKSLSNYDKIILANEKAVKNSQYIFNAINEQSNNLILQDTYGGLYIDNEQNLIVQLVEEKFAKANNKNVKAFDTINELADNIEYVKYSYKELEAVYNRLNELFLSDSSMDNVSSFYIDVFNNCVTVELMDNSINKIVEFKNNCMNTPIIVFKKGEKGVITANPGGGLAGGTLGFRAKDSSGNTGFVTAGHAYKGIDDYELGGYVSGYVTGYKVGGAVDAAFLKSGSSITNITNNYPQLTISTTEYNGYLSPGQMISRDGKTTGRQSGTITSLSWSGKLYVEKLKKDIAYTNLTSTTVYNRPGDSGGPVFTTGLSSTYLLGISTGSLSDKMVFTKYSAIKSALNISRY